MNIQNYLNVYLNEIKHYKNNVNILINTNTTQLY